MAKLKRARKLELNDQAEAQGFLSPEDMNTFSKKQIREEAKAEREYINSLTDKELESDEKKSKKRKPKPKKTTTKPVGRRTSKKVDESKDIDGAGEIEFEKFESSVTRGAKSVTEWLDDLDSRLTDFGKETLGVNVPVAVVQAAVKATKLAVKATTSISEVVDSVVNNIKASEWYKSEVEGDAKAEAETEQKVRDLFVKPIEVKKKKKSKATKPAKEKAAKDTDVEGENVSKQTDRAAGMEQDEKVKKKLKSIGTYKVQTFEQVSRYVDDLIETLGAQGAINYVSNPENNVSTDLKVATLTEAGARVVQEGKTELRKAQKSGDTEAEYAANENMLRGYDAINQASQIKTKAGQIIAYTRNSYSKYPSVFLLEQMNRFEGSNKGDLDNEYSEDSEGNSVTAKEEINNLKDNLSDKIGDVVEKKMNEILDKLSKSRDENKALLDEIEKLKAARDKKLGTKKERTARAKTKFNDALAKFKDSGSKSGKTSASVLFLNQDQIEAILEMISALVEMGAHGTNQIVSKVYNAVKDSSDGKRLTKDHIFNIAIQNDEFNAQLKADLESGKITSKEILKGEDLKKIITDHYKGRSTYARTLAQAIVSQTDLDLDTAKAIALSIEQDLKADIDAMVEKELRKMLLNDRESMAELKAAKADGTITENQEADLEKRLKNSENTAIHNKLVKAVNMGALGRSTDIQRAFEGKFGFKMLPDSVRNRLNAISDRLADLEADLQKELLDAEGNVIGEVSTRHVEQIGRLQKEFNTLLESQRPVNASIVLKELVSLQYIAMLSGLKTFGRAFIGGYGSGFFGSVAYNMMNVVNPRNWRALGAGYKAAIKSLPAAWSRARTARKTGYDFFGENALKGEYSTGKTSRVEKALLRGLGDAINSGNVPAIVMKVIGQTLKVIHVLGALDTFMNTVSGNFVGTVEQVKAARKGSMNGKVSELLKDKKTREADYNAIAEEEYSNLEKDIARDVDEDIKAGNVSKSKRDIEIKRRLRSEMGITGSHVSAKRTYKVRRVQELRENALENHFQEGVSLAKDASMMGKPDGVTGIAVEKMQEALNIKHDDNVRTAVFKTFLNSIFKFVRITGSIVNKSMNNIPVLGIANAMFGPGWDPIKQEWIGSMAGGKRKANPLLMKQRIAVNVLVSGMILAAMVEMFEFGDEDDDNLDRLKNLLNPKKWKLDPNRSMDIRGFGFGGMGGSRKNRRLHEDWENMSFSFTKDKDGRFIDYKNTRLIPEAAAVMSTLGAFTDDFKGDASGDDVWRRMSSPVLTYSEKVLSNNMKIFTESSFSSIGRITKNFTMKDEVTEGIMEASKSLLSDNVKPFISPAAMSSATKYIQASQQVNVKSQDSFLRKLVGGVYGLDHFTSNERTDLFGNPYPVENDIESFIYGIQEKRSKTFDKTVGLLYKFDKGLNIGKWSVRGYERGQVFKVKGDRREYRSTDSELAEEILKLQEEKFRELVLKNHTKLDEAKDRESLSKRMKKYQTYSKNYAEKELLKKYFNKNNPTKGKIILVEPKN